MREPQDETEETLQEIQDNIKGKKQLVDKTEDIESDLISVTLTQKLNCVAFIPSVSTISYSSLFKLVCDVCLVQAIMRFRSQQPQGRQSCFRETAQNPGDFVCAD